MPAQQPKRLLIEVRDKLEKTLQAYQNREGKGQKMLNENAINFFLYSYFGFELKDLKNESEDVIIMKCAQRAYRDLNRTLDFKEKTGDETGEAKKRIEDAHKEFCNQVCEVIKTQIKKLLDSDEKDFDKNHKAACQDICAKASKTVVLAQALYKGQAQKWLNMTMKYMWLLGLRQKDFSKLISVMHVPVDSYILQAVWEEDKEGKVEIPLNDGKERKDKYSDGKDGKVKAWSQWIDDKDKDDDYTKFQKSLRTWCKSKGENPIEWEGPEWIKIASSRSSV